MIHRNILLVIICVLIGVACVWQQLHISHLHYLNTRERNKIRKAKEQKRTFRAKLARLQNPETLKENAPERFRNLTTRTPRNILHPSEAQKRFSREQRFRELSQKTDFLKKLEASYERRENRPKQLR